MKKRNMPQSHGWRCAPGQKIFVADRGAVRFDFPESWVVTPGDASVQMRDKPKPDDRLLLEVSYMALPPIAPGELPIEAMLRGVMEDEVDKGAWSGEIVRADREDIEVCWAETTFVEPVEKREACSRTCLARANDIQSLITFAFWPEDRAIADEAWSGILGTLQLGVKVGDIFRRDLH